MAQTIAVSSGQDHWRNYHPRAADPQVLLVEGNQMERAHHRKLLEICSYKVTEVNDVPAALAVLRAKKESFYFVIADASVPEANTCLFMETLKRDKLPIIYMANELNASVMEGASNMGACLLLEKPLHLSTIKTLWFSVESEKKSQLKIGRLVAACAALTMKNRKLELLVKEATALRRGNAVNERTNEVYEISADNDSSGLNQWPQGQGENESHQLASIGIASSSSGTKRKFGEQAFVYDTQNQQTDWAVGIGHPVGVSDQYASNRYQRDKGKGKAVENHEVIYNPDNYSEVPEQISMQSQHAHQHRLLMANARIDPFELGNSSKSTVLGMRKTSITQEPTEIYQQQRSEATSSLRLGRLEQCPQSNGDNQPVGSAEAMMEPDMFPISNGLNSRATTASGAFNQHEMLPHFIGQPFPQMQINALDEQIGNSMHHPSHHYPEANAATETNIMNWQENSNHMQGLYPPMIEMQMMEPNRSATNDAGNGGSSSTNEFLNQMRMLADVPPQSGVFHSAVVSHGDPSFSNLISMTDATAVSSSEQMWHDIGEWFSGLDQQDYEFLMSIVEPPPKNHSLDFCNSFSSLKAEDRCLEVADVSYPVSCARRAH